MTPRPEVRVLTYNVRGLRDDRAGVREVVRAAGADVVCFQEAPGGPLWRQRCSALTRTCDLLYVAGGQPAAGNVVGVATRVDVYGTTDLALSRTPRLMRRGVSSALLGIGGVRFGVVGLHAGLSAAERTRHADEILAVVARLQRIGARGVVVAGDLNADPARPEWRRLVAALPDTVGRVPGDAGPTFPAAAPVHRIDVVLASPELEVVSVEVFEHPRAADASDHRPVLAVLRLPAPV